MSTQESYSSLEASVARRPAPQFVLAPAAQSAIPARRDTGWLQAFLKRSLDLAVSLPLLLLCAPLLLIIAGLIRMDSAGPVLFRQTRRGKGGKPFDIVKFRSMRVMENGDDVVQAVRNDPRITRFGAWLRKSSLDELPQLWNVISGEMSLVGPRPHARAHDQLYGILIADYTLRQSVKPGITGWAQIHGHRGETSTLEAMRRRVELDLWYARHCSAALDVKILLRTPLEVLRSRNAY